MIGQFLKYLVGFKTMYYLMSDLNFIYSSLYPQIRVKGETLDGFHDIFL